MKTAYIGKILVLGALLFLAACTKQDSCEIIQTVPSTNNPGLIIDSNRSAFSPGIG